LDFGGFISGASLAINGFRQWSKIKKLDNLYGSKYAVPPKPAKEELKDDAKYVVVNCGLCFHQYRVRKGQGIIKTKCPNCGREARISTWAHKGSTEEHATGEKTCLLARVPHRNILPNLWR